MTRRADVVLAVALAVAGWVELSLGGLSDPGLRAVLTGMAALPLAFRVTAIAIPVAAQMAAIVAYTAAGIEPETAGETLALLALAYSVGRVLELRRSVAVIAALAAVNSVLLIADDGAADILWVVGVFVVPPWAAGRIMRDRAERIAELEAITRALDLERERAAELAAEAERARIAQDIRLVLHDALASMTRRAAAPPSAEAFEAIRTEGSAAAAELRRLLGLLHARARTPNVDEPGP